jgi:hypothetical protein
MPAPALPGFLDWRTFMGASAGSIQDYQRWLADNNMSARDFVRLNSQPGGVQPSDQINPLTGQPNPSPPLSGIPVPGQPLPTPIAPPQPPIPGPGMRPAFAPPPVQMPQMLPAAAPQGLGGMPLIRDRMMASTMRPFQQPNWSIPQVPAEYLTQQMPLPGGSTAGIPVQYAGLGRMQIPRTPTGPVSA